MAEDPHVREIGRLTDEQGRLVIIGVDHDTVTLRTLRTRTSGAVTLGSYQAEELGQLFVSACWQAGWHQGRASGQDGEP